jgi:hypothetical protein
LKKVSFVAKDILRCNACNWNILGLDPCLNQL